MARKAEQLELIDVDDPKFKDVKKKILNYESFIDEKKERSSEDKVEEKKKRQAVLAAVIEAKVKPDGDGIYHVPMNGRIYDISQEAQLKITKHKAPKEEEPAAKKGEDKEEGADPEPDGRDR